MFTRHGQENKAQTHHTGSNRRVCISEVRTVQKIPGSGTELAHTHTLLKKQPYIFSLAQLTHSLLCSQTAAKTHCLFTRAEQGQICPTHSLIRCPSPHCGPAFTSAGSYRRRLVRDKKPLLPTPTAEQAARAKSSTRLLGSGSASRTDTTPVLSLVPTEPDIAPHKFRSCSQAHM